MLIIGQIPSTLLPGDGSATAPAYSFASDPDTGFYRAGSGETGYASNGARSLVFSADGRIYGAATGSQYVQLPSTGGVDISAAGTNQNITLTPSGTGNVVVTGANAGNTGVLTVSTTGSNPFALNIVRTDIASTGFRFFIGAGPNLSLRNNAGTDTQTWTNGGSSLFGTTTDSSNGRIQNPGTTFGTGYGIGTTMSLYAASASGARLEYGGSSDFVFQLQRTGGTAASWQAYLPSGTNNLVFRGGSGPADALTLDSSQNAHCSGRITGKTYVQSTGTGAINNTTDNGRTFTNEGAAAMVTLTLPTASEGLTYRFFVQDADGVTVTANAGDTIRIEGAVTAAAGSVSSTTIGSALTLVAINAVEWVATAKTGTWA